MMKWSMSCFSSSWVLKICFFFGTLSCVSSLIQSFHKTLLPSLKPLSMRRIMVRLYLGSNYSLCLTCVCLLLFVYDSLLLRTGSEVLSHSVATQYLQRKFASRWGSCSLDWACSSGRWRSVDSHLPVIGQISQVSLVICGVLCFYLFTHITPILPTSW